jgi:hypothetical protein
MLEYMCANVPDAVGCDSNPLCQQYFQRRNSEYSDHYILQAPAEIAIERWFDVGCSIEVFQDFYDDDLGLLLAFLANRCRYFVFSSTPRTGPSPSFDKEWGHVNYKRPEEWDTLFAKFQFKRMAINTPISPWARCYENVKLARLFRKQRVVPSPTERVGYYLREIRGRKR